MPAPQTLPNKHLQETKNFITRYPMITNILQSVYDQKGYLNHVYIDNNYHLQLKHRHNDWWRRSGKDQYIFQHSLDLSTNLQAQEEAEQLKDQPVNPSVYSYIAFMSYQLQVEDPDSLPF